ncbi:MAG: NAD-dependent epimerase/dehydratase family protein [Gemmatimonadota bacterium]
MSVPRSLFVTGASGFVGRHLLGRLDPARFERITLLTRRTIELPGPLASDRRVEQVRGGLNRPARYAAAIDDGTAVVHLAGRTGSAAPGEFERANVEGTRHLLDAAETQGARGFLFVSTIAVTFPRTSSYPYAESKRRAEQIVRGSTLRWTIVRPTIVLGRGSPTWRKFRSLARAPLLLVPGDGRARIQPIHADDLAALLLRIVDEDRFEGEILELGGLDQVTLAEFLRRAHERYHRRRGPAFRVPLAPGLAVLRAAERLVPLPLPVSASQFTSFREDGIAEPNSLSEAARGQLRGVDAMLDELTEE